MRRLSIIIVFVATSMIASAQTRGGEITRKPQVNSNIRKQPQTTPNSSNNNVNRIERNIEGIILGVSTQQDVINLLKKNGNEYKLHTPATNYAVIVSNGSFNYLGIRWEAAMYKFYNNKVFLISHVVSGNQNEGKNIVLTGVFLRNYFDKKYPNHYVPTKSDNTQYEDGKTLVIIEGGKPEPEQELMIHFGDVKVYDFLNK